MSELLKLAERCERAEGPSRELDRKIFEAATGLSASYQALGFSGKSVTRHMDTPRYSASIDAALTLVPDGSGFLMEFRTITDESSVNIFRDAGPADGEDMEGGKVMTRSVRAKTPALALCAAALKARARAEGEE